MKQAVNALGEAVSLLTIVAGDEVGSRDEIKEWARDLAAAETEVGGLEELLAWHAREVGADTPLSLETGARVGEVFDSLLDLYRKTGIGEQEGLAPALPLSTAPMAHGR
ncbi:MAG: hypothetical protein U0974_15815 [Gemmatimonadales bacterium]|nr:hypothetical protein [Gemmatimonadales bacterium]